MEERRTDGSSCNSAEEEEGGEIRTSQATREKLFVARNSSSFILTLTVFFPGWRERLKATLSTTGTPLSPSHAHAHPTTPPPPSSPSYPLHPPGSLTRGLTQACPPPAAVAAAAAAAAAPSPALLSAGFPRSVFSLGAVVTTAPFIVLEQGGVELPRACF